MALIKCPECGREISDKAVSCPGCGCPITSTTIFKELLIKCEDKRKLRLSKNILYFIDKKDKVSFSDNISNYMLLFYGDINKALVIVISNGKWDSPCGYRICEESNQNAHELIDILIECGTYVSGLSYYKAFKYRNEEQRIRKIEKKEQTQQNLQAISNMCGGSKVPRCPKCHSTSISYQNKVSVGRAAVGGALAGPTGAVLGGLTGKKGYAVCLNCGKRWKI